MNVAAAARRPIQATARMVMRRPPRRSKVARADQNVRITAAASAIDHVVARGSIESGRAGPAIGLGGAPSRVARSIPIDAGDKANRIDGGRGSSCRTPKAKQASNAASTSRCEASKRGGKIAARRAAPAVKTASTQRSRPPNANRIQAVSARSATAPHEAPRRVPSDGFGVVVLVLVTVVARIVVLVSREIDLVEDDGHHLWMTRGERLNR